MALNIRDCVSLVGRGSSVVGAQLRNMGKFVFTPHCLFLSHDSLYTVGPFYLVTMPGGSKISHTGGTCITCRGHHCLEYTRLLRTKRDY